MSTGICVDMRVDMCVDICINMCINRHVYRHAFRYAYSIGTYISELDVCLLAELCEGYEGSIIPRIPRL